MTSLAFLSSSRSHLLVTASEANSSIKVWDIRSRYSRRATALPVPVSYTRVPDLHRQHRNFGINSLVLNGNESRLYALSRDSTLYAYSTNHLILGSAPELDPPGSVSSSSSNAHFSSEVKEGLGPLYGFRHPDFRATSFYVKAALRPARGDKPELIAVGNSHRTPILFSTDERDFQRVTKSTTDSSAESAASTPITGRSVSFRAALASKETVPIYNTGVALRHGHRKEVTGVEWSANGDLVTISDDFTARCWREDQEHARMLRSDQDEGADKYMCGWAEMEDGYDEVDG